MNYKNIQKLIDDTNYWDARVENVDCKYFADEVTMAFVDDGYRITYKFMKCYKVLFDHIKSYKKNISVKNMSYAQIPYFLTNINVDEACEQKQTFIKCQITMFPLNLEIWCKDIAVKRNPIL